MTLFRRTVKLAARSATATTLVAGLAAVTLVFSTQTGAQGAEPTVKTPNCATAVTGAPAGRATVSAKSTPYGRVLVVGSGDEAGCSLYVLTSDALHSLTSAPFACSDNANPTGAPCDTVLWPALLTKRAPIAGPGVNPKLLGTVTRTDMSFGGPVQQVTYAGLPLYRFFLDEVPGEREGANLFDPVTSPTGIWYLVHPGTGLPARGPAQLRFETAPLGGTTHNETVLAVSMNDTFSLFAGASFPVYTLSSDREHTSRCQAQCALAWPPVLTSGKVEAPPDIDKRTLGTIVRPDGSHQVTYDGQPLYLFRGDAYIPGIPGVSGPASINGAGLTTPWGEFNTISPAP
jgi:predicted lipoprotein with Yx(FWY)xxD motif